MAARDCHEMMRLGYRKVSKHDNRHKIGRTLGHMDFFCQILLKTNSKFFPGELTMKIGEHWEFDMPDLGKATVSVICHDFADNTW